MAEYVDELRLGIKVEDNDSGEKVRSLANAIARLNQVIAQVDVGKLSATFAALKNEVGGFAAELKSAEKSLVAMAAIMQKGGIAGGKKAARAANVGAPTGGNGTDEGGKAAREQQKVAKDIAEAEDKSEKSKKEQVSLGKKQLVQDLLRVGRYRAIRALLKEITKGIQTAMQEAAKQSPELQKTMSSVTSSMTIIQSSLGGIVASVLPVIEPVLKVVAQLVGNISNAISKTVATLSGQSQYLKINTEYWKEYNEQVQGTLLSFDTFNTLNAQSDSQLFSVEEIGKNEQEFDTLRNVFQSILVSIGIIAALPLIKWIIGGGISKIVIGGLKSTLTLLKSIGSVQFLSFMALVAGVTLLIEGIKKIQREWNNVNFEGWEKAVVIVSALIAGVVGLVVAIKAIKLPIAAAIGLGAALAGSILLLGTHLATQTKAFANGGMFEGAGTMYAIAGENGAEVVAQGSSGTGVLNVSQFKQAMVEALYEYGAARGQLDGVSVKMDSNTVGRVVASSGGFKNEAVRRGNTWR